MIRIIIEHYELNFVKIRASGIGHRASGIGHRASGIGNKSALLAALVVSALSLVSVEQGQAQLYVDIFPSRDSTNNTLWMFSGSSTVWGHNNLPPNVRTSGGYDRRDTSKTSSAFLRNTPANDYALTPLFTATATNAPNDLATLDYWKGRTIDWGTTNTNDDLAIPSTATNAPMLTIGSSSRSIATMHLNDVYNTGWDDIGPRVGGSGAFGYSDNSNTPSSVSWSGAAVMAKPIGDFFLTTPGTYNGGRRGNLVLSGLFAQENKLRIRVHAMVPEPKEYALVFGLFALGFVIVRRHFQKKRQPAAAS